VVILKVKELINRLLEYPMDYDVVARREGEIFNFELNEMELEGRPLHIITIEV